MELASSTGVTARHIQAALVVFLGSAVTEHYRLFEIITDPSRFGTIWGRVYLLSLLVYTVALTYCVTDLSHKPDATADEWEEFPAVLNSEKKLLSAEFSEFSECGSSGDLMAESTRADDDDLTLTRCTASPLYHCPKKAVTFNRLQRKSSFLQSLTQVLIDNDADLITAKTLSKNIYVPLILGHATMFTGFAYVMATYSIYGYASIPLIILCYSALMNTNALLRNMVPHPVKRWVWTISLHIALYCYRLRGKGPAPDTFHAIKGELWSLLLVLMGTVLGCFYLAFVAGCSIQCAFKDVTLQDLYNSFRDKTLQYHSRLARAVKASC